MSSDEKQGQMPPNYAPSSTGYPQVQSGYGQPQYPQPQVQYSGASHTTVIVQQPGAGAPGGAPRMWTTGIMGCTEDMGICLCGWCFPLCLACQIATDIGESGCVPCCVPGGDIALRLKWRIQENIAGSIMDDCLTALCCGTCALCQLAREIKRKREGTLYARA